MTDKPEARHLDWRTLLTAGPDTPPDVLAALDNYFAPFAQPPLDGDHDCLSCGEPLTGLMSVLTGKGGFQWGLVHGEGRCANCGWPARAHHRPKLDGEELFSLTNYPLQYHPDHVEKR